MGLHAWGNDTDELEMIAAVETALDNGVTLFDTADVYGLGTSESILGNALGRRRSMAKIATKFGVRRTDDGRSFYDNSPDWIDLALDASLKRLGTDYIDLYQVHYYDGVTPLVDLFGHLEKKRTEGKILAYGISNVCDFGNDELLNLDTISMEYSLANREHESAIRKLKKEKDLTFFSWGSLGQGVLAGIYDQFSVFDGNDRRSRETYTNFHGEKFKHNLAIVEEMRGVSRDLGKTLPQIAIRWILDYLMGSNVVLVGIKRSSDIKEAVGAFDWKLTGEAVSLLESISRNGAFPK
tara:strand:+ start:349 stop:1233 length:885 start_codon:yes stop_codon:yes gene_type:complete